MKHASRLLVLTAAVTAMLMLGHNPASASVDSYDGIAMPTFVTQISLTDDSQLTCHAGASADTSVELF